MTKIAYVLLQITMSMAWPGAEASHPVAVHLDKDGCETALTEWKQKQLPRPNGAISGRLECRAVEMKD
jgi:hypothetical protein